jgi:hypothetical protein
MSGSTTDHSGNRDYRWACYQTKAEKALIIRSNRYVFEVHGMALPHRHLAHGAKVIRMSGMATAVGLLAVGARRRKPPARKTVLSSQSNTHLTVNL